MDGLIVAAVACVLFGLLMITVVIAFMFWWSLLAGSIKTLLGEW